MNSPRISRRSRSIRQSPDKLVVSLSRARGRSYRHCTFVIRGNSSSSFPSSSSLARAALQIKQTEFDSLWYRCHFLEDIDGGKRTRKRTDDGDPVKHRRDARVCFSQIVNNRFWSNTRRAILFPAHLTPFQIRSSLWKWSQRLLMSRNSLV